MMTHAQSNQTSKVNIIPATRRHIHNGSRINSHSLLRVAAYCRVSTEEKSQENSYAAQKNHYTMLIKSKPGWEMAGIYADEGKSGTSRKNRIQFNQMLADAKAGKIDYIITKSISRFARNTADALDCVHELQRLRPPVGIYFERENIDTLNTSSEIFLTFYCSMAQEESRSISENIKWSLQNNFRSGKPQINLHRMLGYDPCPDGSWLINEEQAETVRRIYRRFLQGASANAIARELNTAGRPTVNGGIWRSDTIFNILQNEKYAGDLRMQKTYTESFLTHKAVTNNGEYPQYFLQDHHPAIIDRSTWLQAQELLALKRHRGQKNSRKIETSIGEFEIGTGTPPKSARQYGPSASPFHGMTCTKCGAKMRRMTYTASARSPKTGPHESAPYYAVWKCPNSPGKVKTDLTERTCPAPVLTEASMKQAFSDLLCRIRQDYQSNAENAEIIKSFRTIYTSVSQQEPRSEFLEHKLDLLNMQIQELETQYDQLIRQQELASCSSRIQIGPENLPYDHTAAPEAAPPDLTAKYDFFGSAGSAFISMIDSTKLKLDQKKQEKETLLEYYSLPDTMKKNFDTFLNAVQSLPDPTENTTNFDHYPVHYIMRKFILKIYADGDEVFYSTTFGVRLKTVGNGKR